jgi:hypothetical protein
MKVVWEIIKARLPLQASGATRCCQNPAFGTW